MSGIETITQTTSFPQPQRIGGVRSVSVHTTKMHEQDTGSNSLRVVLQKDNLSQIF
jgi:hypothetical protein